MVTIETFLKSTKDDIFIDEDSDFEYNKYDLDEAFQYEQSDGSIGIKEYHEKLTDFLKGFKKQKILLTNTTKGDAL